MGSFKWGLMPHLYDSLIFNLIEQFHIPVPRGFVASSPEEVKRIVSDIGESTFT